MSNQADGVDCTPVRKVHVIYKTHLDIGFTDYARNVIENYFSRYIPAAIGLARQMREEGKPERFLWTTGSWLIYEYLEQADTAARRATESAIGAGDIAWHGLPFTSHTELMDPDLFRFGLGLSRELDRRFGKTTVAAKMTDVPGHTRSMIPFMAEAGLQFLHIGVNIACRPPDVPPLFTWQHPDGTDLVVMYNTGYGGVASVPGLDQALAFAHTGDNCGPQSADQIREGYAQIRKQFPGAKVVASTLDAFAAALLPLKQQFPVVTREIGDTWIHGAGTDPWKVAAFRELCRCRANWLATGRVNPRSPAFQRSSRSLLLVAEHTWGLNEEVHLSDFRNYSRRDFEIARKKDLVGNDTIPRRFQYTAGFRSKKRPPRYSTFEASWAEQRDYVHAAVKHLGGTRVEAEAKRALANLKPVPASRAGWKTVPPSSRQDTAHFSLGFDPVNGALVTLTNKTSGRRWADARHPVGLFGYQTFSQADYDRYLKQYCINMKHDWCWVWAIPDLSKPGMDVTHAESRWWLPSLERLSVRREPAEHRFRVELVMPDKAVNRYGAPAEVTVEYRLPDDAPRIEVVLQWFGKAANRLPEALWFSFCPRETTPAGWQLDKLGSPVSPLDVVRYGNRRLHAVYRGMTYADDKGRLAIRTPDSPLVAPGSPGLLDFNQRQPDLRKGMHVNLYNNIWGTNFPMWYGEDGRFRFSMEWSIRSDSPNSVVRRVPHR